MKVRLILILMRTKKISNFFETTKNVDRILQNLMLTSGQTIVPEKTLIVFDEVQGCLKRSVFLRECVAAPYCLRQFPAWHCSGEVIFFSGGQGQPHLAKKTRNIYKAAKEGARACEYKDALQCLVVQKSRLFIINTA